MKHKLKKDSLLQPKKILVAPLNWGLGHATRCIPIIKELSLQGASVFLASDGRALDLLRKEFPELPVFQLPEYGVTYTSKSIILNILMVLPKLVWAVFKEHKIVKEITTEHRIDGIISDNRLGCFSKKIPSVFITHQINLIIPSTLLQWIGRRLNYFFIKKYSECWIPDVAKRPNLSGILSHGTPIKSVTYIGALSRLEKRQVDKKFDVVVVLSGPEPQRTNLEKAIFEQAALLPYQFLIVQGKTEASEQFMVGGNIQVVSSLTSQALNEAILSSDLFIGRTGYSSIMDLAKLNKPALLIPTPGQTEQEYLGHLFSKNDIFHIQSQDELDLAKGIPAALQKRHVQGHYFDEGKMKQTVRSFLDKCRPQQ
jgi:UDP:flavonoid glycosyltransferase YjiC (YdhE family)